MISVLSKSMIITRLAIGTDQKSGDSPRAITLVGFLNVVTSLHPATVDYALFKYKLSAIYLFGQLRGLLI